MSEETNETATSNSISQSVLPKGGGTQRTRNPLADAAANLCAYPTKNQ
ncbi:MAG: hypothetical protein NTU47_16580 [Ignavibacteriales bacterium]|nr:hypothetical protein [Ignavibacteriales bacterium]